MRIFGRGISVISISVTDRFSKFNDTAINKLITNVLFYKVVYSQVDAVSCRIVTLLETKEHSYLMLFGLARRNAVSRQSVADNNKKAVLSRR